MSTIGPLVRNKFPLLPVLTYMRDVNIHAVLYERPDSPKPHLTIDARRMCNFIVFTDLLFTKRRAAIEP